MKTSDVVTKLYEELPKHSTLFTVESPIQSAQLTAGKAIITTTSAHNLATNDLVTIKNVSNPINIVSMARVGTVITVTSLTNHDLTEKWQTTVAIAGANETEFNGTFTLLKVPNRKTFTLQTADSGPTASTGSPQMLDGTGIGYNGQFKIEVLDTTRFQFDATPSIVNNGIVSTSSTASTGYRITGAISIERALEVYTNKNLNDPWAFVVLGRVVASKDRNNQSDAVYVFGGTGTQYKQQLIQTMSIYVISNSTAYVSSTPIRDSMEDLFPALTKSILGVGFDSRLAQSTYYRLVFDQHGFVQSNTAQYIHEFRFQIIMDLTSTDTNEISPNVAFRDINIDLKTNLMNENSPTITSKIDLDDNPLP